MKLAQVQSFAYIIGANAGELPNQQAFGASSVQLIFAGTGPGELNLNRAIADPRGDKIILGYVDASECNTAVYPQFMVGGKPPAWFGPQLFPGQYSVQYWNPAWLPAVCAEIDKLAAAGYDGVFIDSVSGYLQWQAGNSIGNAPYANAVPAMAALISGIVTHVRTFAKPFYVVGNSPGQVATDFPAVIGSTDAVFNELLYFKPEYVPANAAYVAGTEAPIYQKLGIRVFGNDYTPAGDMTSAFTSFAFYAARGWVPGFGAVTQKTDLLSSGPHMAMAVPGSTTVIGVQDQVNFLSGGMEPNATLIGGNQGNYFIGGPGQNVIVGGSGNDTIYAHPASAAYLAPLSLRVAAHALGGASLPAIQVKINGQVAYGPTAISDTTGAAVEVDLDVSRFGSIVSLEVDAIGVLYTSGAVYNVAWLNSATLCGQPLSAALAALGKGAVLNGTGFTLNEGATVGWQGAAVPSIPPLANTAAFIEAGGGLNTVVYRGALAQYVITKARNGSVYVRSISTAEGPDTLRGVRFLRFTDQTVDVNTLAAA